MERRADGRFIIQIPHKCSELEATKARLLAIGAPPQHAEHIDTMLADVDAGRAQCVPEDCDD